VVRDGDPAKREVKADIGTVPVKKPSW